MNLLVLGINHKTAPVSLREQVAFSPEKWVDALLQLKQIDAISGVVIVSTCNRTEIYCEQDDAHAGVLIDWLVTFHQLDNQELLDSLYIHQNADAVRHLMRVGAGLDSLVLGEPQILGQVKQAYALSVEHQAVSGVLERLFHSCFMVAKKVRTETDIGGSAVSVAFAACSLAKQIFESLEKSTVLLVGAGETVELVAKHLYEQKCRQIIVANRSRERAEPFAAAFGANIILLEDIPLHMHHADIVISSTAAPLPIIGKGMVEKALKARRQQPMLLIDIAVPRDIEAQVAELDDAYLYTVDDLHSIVERNLAQRKTAAIQAEAIITTEVQVFITWLRSRSSVGSIRAYRTHADELKTALINKSLQALANGADPQQVVVELGNKLTNKLIHAPTQAMQHAAKLGDEQTLMTLRHCLGLEPQK